MNYVVEILTNGGFIWSENDSWYDMKPVRVHLTYYSKIESRRKIVLMTVGSSEFLFNNSQVEVKFTIWNLFSYLIRWKTKCTRLSKQEATSIHKMYQTVETRNRGNIDTLCRYLHDRSLSWFSTGTSIKSGGVKLVWWPKPTS